MLGFSWTFDCLFKCALYRPTPTCGLYGPAPAPAPLPFLPTEMLLHVASFLNDPRDLACAVKAFGLSYEDVRRAVVKRRGPVKFSRMQCDEILGSLPFYKYHWRIRWLNEEKHRKMTLERQVTVGPKRTVCCLHVQENTRVLLRCGISDEEVADSFRVAYARILIWSLDQDPNSRGWLCEECLAPVAMQTEAKTVPGGHHLCKMVPPKLVPCMAIPVFRFHNACLNVVANKLAETIHAETLHMHRWTVSDEWPFSDSSGDDDGEPYLSMTAFYDRLTSV